MGFLGKIFGTRSRLEKMQAAMKQANYVDVLHLAENADADSGAALEIAALKIEAADALARLNLAEAQRSLQAGNTLLAEEHLQLAHAQACSSQLIKQIKAVQLEATEVRSGLEISATPETLKAANCGGCAPAPQPATRAALAAEDLPDLQSQLELLLAAYPLEMQQDYLASSDLFLQAFFLIHDGEDRQALALLLQVPVADQAEPYLFELGSLYCRLGDPKRGLGLLHRAVSLNPGNLLVVDALLQLIAAKDGVGVGLKFLKQQHAAGADAGYCHAQCCALQSASQDHAAAQASALLALEAGYVEPGFLVLAANLFEGAGKISEAENLLMQLPGGGCGGGISLPLAEFWLRQNRELAKILDAFNGACRQEPDNPRWPLRVAQTYIARKWRKQGLEILQRVVGDPRLEDQLRVEAEQLLSQC